MLKFGWLVFAAAFGSMYVQYGVCSAAGMADLTAKSAIVIEAKTGRVIYAKDAEVRRYPASTTKMMTLLVALEQGKLSDVVAASQNASATEGSSIWLEPGEELTLSDLLYGMMLVSGNDATVAVAEHIAGSVEAFAQRMTKKAHEIGAKDTLFMNSSGLPDPKHYSTAHDLARIAAYGYRNPQFEQIVSTQEKVIPWAAKTEDRMLSNENWLLWIYEGGNGVKTGYTEAAGRCLVSAAKREGVQLIAVVLDSTYMWNDSMALLDYGFSQIRSVPLYKAGDALKTVHVAAGRQNRLDLVVDGDIDLPVVGNERQRFSAVIDAPERVQADVRQGEKLGTVQVLYDGVPFESADLVAKESVVRKSFFRTLYQFIVASAVQLWNKIN